MGKEEDPSAVVSLCPVLRVGPAWALNPPSQVSPPITLNSNIIIIGEVFNVNACLNLPKCVNESAQRKVKVLALTNYRSAIRPCKVLYLAP